MCCCSAYPVCVDVASFLHAALMQVAPLHRCGQPGRVSNLLPRAALQSCCTAGQVEMTRLCHTGSTRLVAGSRIPATKRKTSPRWRCLKSSATAIQSSTGLTATDRQVQLRLWAAIKESQSGQNGDLVRAVARACLSGSHGFKACANGYVLTPVPYSVVAEHIRADCPGISFRNDFSSATLDEEDSDGEEGEDAEEQQYDYYQDSYASSYSNQYTHDSDQESDDSDSDQDDDSAWTLTQLLGSDDCQRFFMVLRSFKGSQPYVSTDLHALIEEPQLEELCDVLPSVHTRAVHPDQLTHMTKQKAAPDTSTADPQLVFSAVLAALEQTTLHNSQDITDADDIPAFFAKLIIKVCRMFSEEVLDHLKPHWDVLTAAQEAQEAGDVLVIKTAKQAASLHALAKIAQAISIVGTCCVFDILQANTGVMHHLKAMLEDNTIMKVFHDCRQDSAALFYQKGIKMQFVFDLQVAQEVLGYTKSLMHVQEHKTQLMGLQQLLAKHHLPVQTSKSAIQGKYKKTPNLWKQRPLPKALLQSAAEDVAQLGKLADEMIASLGSELTAMSRC